MIEYRRKFVTNLNFNFPQVVRQHTFGVVGYITWFLQFTTLSNGERISKTQFRQSYCHHLVVHFLGHSVYCTTIESRLDTCLVVTCFTWFASASNSVWMHTETLKL